MALVFERHPGMTVREFGRLTPYQVRHVYLRPKAESDRQPHNPGPDATAAAYVEYFKRLGLGPEDAAQRARGLK
jgi:hypothetical protein